MTRLPDDTLAASVEPFHSVKIAAHEMARKVGESGRTFDRLACILPSGGIVVTLVGQHLGFDPLKTLVVPVARNPAFPQSSRLEFHTGSRMPVKEDVEGQEFLLVGDVWRRGGLLKYAAQILGQLGASTSIGVMYMRDDALTPGVAPDFYGLRASGEVLFDWHTSPEGYEPIMPVRHS